MAMALEWKFAELEEMMQLVNSEQHVQNTRLDRLHSEQLAQHDHLHEIDTEQGVQNGRLDDIDAEQKVQNTHLHNLDAEQHVQNRRLNDIDTKQVVMNERLNDIDAEQKVQKTRLDNIDIEQIVQNGRLDDIDSEQSVQNDRLDDIEAEQSIQNGRLDSISKVIVSLLKHEKSYGFYVHAVTDTDPAVGDILKFGTVQLNEDSAYDVTTGRFTAPIDGIYHFDASICTRPDKTISVEFYMEGSVNQQIGIVRSYATCNSDYATAKLEAGDQVFLKVIDKGGFGSPKLHIGSDRRNSFTGYYVGPMVP